MALRSGRVKTWLAGAATNTPQRATRGTVNAPSDLSAACTIAVCTFAAALTASSALAGPYTTEYGPCIAGKRKIVRTQTTASVATASPMRPEIIDVFTLYNAAFEAQYDPKRWPNTLVAGSSCSEENTKLSRVGIDATRRVWRITASGDGNHRPKVPPVPQLPSSAICGDHEARNGNSYLS